jgi:hypothetical protein
MATQILNTTQSLVNTTKKHIHLFDAMFRNIESIIEFVAYNHDEISFIGDIKDTLNRTIKYVESFDILTEIINFSILNIITKDEDYNTIIIAKYIHFFQEELREINDNLKSINHNDECAIIINLFKANSKISNIIEELQIIKTKYEEILQLFLENLTEEQQIKLALQNSI